MEHLVNTISFVCLLLGTVGKLIILLTVLTVSGQLASPDITASATISNQTAQNDSAISSGKQDQLFFTYKVEADLRRDLLMNYNKLIRPDPRVEVDVAFVLHNINYMSIKEQELSTTGYLILRWVDKRFVWENNYPYNKSVINLFTTEENMWIPTIIFENSVKDVSVLSNPNTPMRIDPNGVVTWSPAGIFVTKCASDVTNFPYDTQSCEIVISTRGYTVDEILLKFNTQPILTSEYQQNGEWLFLEPSYKTGHEQKPEGVQFPRLIYVLNIRRRPFFQTLNIILPTVFLSFLSSMVFKLPVESGEKISYSLTVLLSYAVYLTIVSAFIPSVSLTVSILSVYLVTILFLGVVSVILTIIVMDCFYKDPAKEIPRWVILCVIKIPSCICLENKCNRKRVDSIRKMSDSVADVKTQSSTGKEEEITWQQISRRLDALFIRIYLFLVSLLSICVLATLAYGFNS